MSSLPWHSHYDRGVPHHLAYPKTTVDTLLFQAAQSCPERACIIFEDQSLSYRQVARAVEKLSTYMANEGVKEKDRVGILLTNSPEFIISYYAILRLGAVVVALNPLFTPAELSHQVKDAGLNTIVCADAFYSRLLSVRQVVPIARILIIGKQAPETDDTCLTRSQTTGNLEPNIPTISESSSKPADIAIFQYTGGTTGAPKAAIATHANLIANSLQFKAWMSTLEPERETFLLALPLYHIYGMVCGMLLGITMRATLVVLPNPRDIPALLTAIQSHRVTYFPAAPTLYNAINNSPDVISGKVDLTSIKACISGSAPLSEQTKSRFESLTGGRIVEGYGLSEAPTATHCNPVGGENRLGSIGLPLPDVIARIVDPENDQIDLPIGTPGELLIQSPQVMQGYHNQPEETRRALLNGWLHTGDIASMDSEGYFYIAGRKKELIKPGGMEVWPKEIEDVIQTHPSVAECAVAGIPDEYRGETVKAWIVLVPGKFLSPFEIQTFCRLSLAPFKIPTHVDFLDSLPRSGVGKVLKRKLLGLD